MKKFNLNSLNKTFDKINILTNDINNKENNIIKSGYKKFNNKSIEIILYVIFIDFT